MAQGSIDPISQFEIKTFAELSLGGMDISITNATLYMALAAVLIIGFFWMTSSKAALVPGRMQSVGEMSYEFVANMIRNIAGEEGLKYFAFVFTLFFFIFAANLIGMFPYFFTTTSHIVVTGVLALAVFFLVTFIGIVKNGFGFLRLFVPSGVPWPILFILVPIEIISYLARPVTLSLRLFANMLAGHIMLKLLVAFAAALATYSAGTMILAPLPFLMAVAITGLEFLVAFLQAFVFAILTCVYLSDALHPGHH